MAQNFCSACGSRVLPDVRFCVMCGAPLEDAQPEAVTHQQPPIVPESPATTTLAETPQTTAISATQPAEVTPQTIESTSSTIEIDSQPTKVSVETTKTIVHQAVSVGTSVANLVGGQMPAADFAGEMTCSETLAIPKTEFMAAVSPFRFIFSSAKGFIRGIPAALKDKKKLIPLLILALIWIVYAILKYFEIESPLLESIGMLTFARGGLGTTPQTIMGGIIGKGMVAYLFTQFFSALFARKNPFSGATSAIKAFFKNLFVRSKNDLSPLLFGFGSALVIYNAISGTLSLSSLAVGISGWVISLKALNQRAGFIKGLYRAFKSRSKNAKTLDISRINRFITGLSLGFAGGIALSTTSIGSLGYWVGLPVMVASVIVLLIPTSHKKEAMS